MEDPLEQAQQLGANAVVNVRYATSSIMGGAAELYVYGTAVFIEDAPAAARTTVSGDQPPPLPEPADG